MEQQEFDYIRNLVYEHAGIFISTDKAYLVEARLKAVTGKFKLNSISELIKRLHKDKNTEIAMAVVEAMTINETSFFRDENLFDTLQRFVIPSLIKERSHQRRLTIWSAACSSGQEPYSMALLLKKRFPELRNWNVRILATDISREILKKAKRGIYSEFEISRGLPELMLMYFQRVQGGWQIKDEIKEWVQFGYCNLQEEWPIRASEADIVLLRNVLIYFPLTKKQRILSRMREVVKDDGYLLLGQSETVSMIDNAFEVTSFLGTNGLSDASCFQLKESFKQQRRQTESVR